MSPMFGHKDEDKQAQLEQWRQATQAELERMNALSLVDLADEVMTKAFGPGGPGADDDAISLGQQNASAGPTAPDISYEFAPDSGGSFPSDDDQRLRARLAKLVAEGLQELEHASLVRAQLHTSMGNLDWAATRRGRAALERGEVRSLLQASAPSPSAASPQAL